MKRHRRLALAAALVCTLIAGIVLVVTRSDNGDRVHVTAYFANTNGLYPGDNVLILGVPVGGIDAITPGPSGVKVRLWFDRNYRVPAAAGAAILSPALVSARVIQLTPAYTSGPTMHDEAVIPQARTAVPVEWDDLRQQLAKLTGSLQPTEPGGVAPLGSLINTGADNLRGQGANIRDALIKLSQALSALGDHSGDIFSTVQNLSVLVSALHSITDVTAQLNENLAATTALLANDPEEVGHVVTDLDTAVRDIKGFVADNREAAGVTTDKLASITQAVVDSLDDLKQTLHVAPNTLANFINIYQPAQAALTGGFVVSNFASPVQFICSAVQAAAKLNGQQSAKLCAQYLAPIFKNRAYNFPPLGENLIVGAQARPNEITYSEDWLRPDHTAPPPPQAPAPDRPETRSASTELNTSPAATPGVGAPAADMSLLPAEAPVATDPAAGLPGLMVPPGS